MNLYVHVVHSEACIFGIFLDYTKACEFRDSIDVVAVPYIWITSSHVTE